MKRRSIWLTIGLLIAATLFAFAGCKGEQMVKYVLSETAISLTVGQEKQLTVSPEPEKSVAWESGDESVATVENGAVKALGAGSTTVTAKIEGVNDALTCTVTVTARPVQSDEYALDFASVSLKTGESKQISVIAQGGGYCIGRNLYERRSLRCNRFPKRAYYGGRQGRNGGEGGSRRSGTYL